MEKKEKDAWDKLDIIFKSIGAFVTAITVALVGIFGTKAISEHQAEQSWLATQRQEAETNGRVYAELISRREESDTSLRKDMFTSIVQPFLSKNPTDLEQEVLALELLAYNFNDSLDLGPLFKSVLTRVDKKKPGEARYLKRLQKVANEVSSKQVATLQEAGSKLDGSIFFSDFDKKIEEIGEFPIIDADLPISRESAVDLPPAARVRHFKLSVLYVRPDKTEIKVRLLVKTPRAGKVGNESRANIDDVDTVFWVGIFDFPMIDNTRLALGQRCAVVCQSFTSSQAELTLVYFPGSRASLKDKPYYEDVIHNVLHTRDMFSKHSKRDSEEKR